MTKFELDRELKKILDGAVDKCTIAQVKECFGAGGEVFRREDFTIEQKKVALIYALRLIL